METRTERVREVATVTSWHARAKSDWAANNGGARGMNRAHSTLKRSKLYAWRGREGEGVGERLGERVGERERESGKWREREIGRETGEMSAGEMMREM